jgi:hypothetical protein
MEFEVIPVTVTSEKLMHKNDTQNLSFACTMQSGRVHDSGYSREVDDNSTLLGFYAASSGNFLLTFRDNLSVP